MRKHERAARWVQVEALCLCAGLERQFGAASSERVHGLDVPEEVKLAALRLLRQRGDFRAYAASPGRLEPAKPKLASLPP